MSAETELNVKGLDFRENRSKDNISSSSAKAAAVEDIEVGQGKLDSDVENRTLGHIKYVSKTGAIKGIVHQFLSDPGVPGPIFVSGCPSVRPSLREVV